MLDVRLCTDNQTVFHALKPYERECSTPEATQWSLVVFTCYAQSSWSFSLLRFGDKDKFKRERARETWVQHETVCCCLPDPDQPTAGIYERASRVRGKVRQASLGDSNELSELYHSNQCSLKK